MFPVLLLSLASYSVFCGGCSAGEVIVFFAPVCVTCVTQFVKRTNVVGIKVKLQSILMPLSEFDHAEKGDALYAMELALSLEKLTNEKLLHVHVVANKNNELQLADFVESEFLGEQVEAIKKISEYVAQLRRVGK